MRKKKAQKKKVDDSEWKKYLPYCQRDIQFYLKFYGYLDYFFNQLEETMQMCGVEDKSRYRMVFGFDS